MTPRTRLLVAACFGVAFGARVDVSTQAPRAGTTVAPGLPPRAASAPPPSANASGVISGRILAADTGLPLRRARVMLHGTGPNIPPGPGANHFAITDAEGAFLFTELSAGRYRLQAAKARYVTGSFGARPHNDGGRSIELADGQTVDHITVSLSPAGVITGRVVDELGEPVEAARVTALREFTGPKGRQFMPDDRSDVTDDAGIYRLYGLQPGEYYVSVRIDDAARFGIGMASGAAELAPTYYPATAVPAEAQAVDVGAAAEAPADITLVRVRLTPVSGVVVNAAGLSATGGSVSVRGTIAVGGPETGTDIKPDGSFTLAWIPPGEYIVEARPSFAPREPLPSAAPSVANRRAVSTSIIVSGEPITGLRLVLPDAIRIPVVATFEGATARPPENVTVFATGAGTGGSEVAMRGPDGRLTLELSPGSWQFGASAPAPWIVKRLAYGGEALGVMDDVEITDGPGGRLEIVFTTKPANLSGSVKDANGTPVADYVVYVLTADEGRTYPSGRWMVINVHPDQAGRFKTDFLRPGAYIALATEEPDPDAPGHDNLMEWLQKAGTPFLLRDSDTVTLDLVLKPRR